MNTYIAPAHKALLLLLAATFLFVVVAGGCCSVTPPGPTTGPWAAPDVVQLVGRDALMFSAWAGPALATLSAHFQVPVPEIAVAFANPPTEYENGHPVAWTLGIYHPGHIIIWARTPRGDRDLASMQDTLLHEFIHHLDEANGAPDPGPDHNAEFARRIVSLKLWEILQK